MTIQRVMVVDGPVWLHCPFMLSVKAGSITLAVPQYSQWTFSGALRRWTMDKQQIEKTDKYALKTTKTIPGVHVNVPVFE